MAGALGAPGARRQPAAGGADAAREQFVHRDMKVFKFMGHIFGQEIKSAIFNNLLVARLAAPTGPQVPAAAPAPAPNIAAEIGALNAAIEAGERQIGVLGNLRTGLKKKFSKENAEDAANAAIAREAFSEIEEGKQRELLQLAFHYAASPENPGDVAFHVKKALESFQAAGAKESNILGAICAISNPKDRAKIFQALAQPDSGFNWGSLNPAEVAEFTVKLVKARNLNREVFSTVLRRLPTFKGINFKGVKAKQVALSLAKEGWAGARCLLELSKNGKLGKLRLNAAEANQIVLDLAKAGPAGARCILELHKKGKLDKLDLNRDEAKQVAIGLAKAGLVGARCILALSKNGKLNMPDLDASAANQLFLGLSRGGWAGICYTKELFRKGKLNSLDLGIAEANQIARNLLINVNNNQESIDFLKQLFEKNILRNLRLKDIDTSAEAKTKALELLSLTPLNVEELRQLLD
ncbi:MAG: hypothetical protein LBE98_03175 [Puniceicoccales bacterium]|jgi:DNA-binding XRE family transcriptional regulator|nr:hypothetical protein [Puniceicoccales bacterium]